MLERDILIWLSTLNIGNSNISKILDEFPNLMDFWNVKDESIKFINSINPQIKDKIIKNRKTNDIEKIKMELDHLNVDVITVLDDNYPNRLREIYDRPNVLYKKGELKEEDNMSIAIVGSRKSTSYGKWAAEKFSKELANMGITIISGLASGIDSVSHRTALDNNGRTIGVLGNGIDKIYPKKNKDLYREIGERGVILTEFPIGTEPLAYNFPQRNRIISGMSLGIIVIEAQEKSGSLITATHALEQGKDVFALPGNINSLFSKGTNKLIKDGAIPLLEIDDILEEIYELRELRGKNKIKDKVNTLNYSDTEIEIIKLIEKGPTHCDEIVYKTGLNISNVTSILTILELKGIVKELSGGIFTI